MERAPETPARYARGTKISFLEVEPTRIAECTPLHPFSSEEVLMEKDLAF